MPWSEKEAEDFLREVTGALNNPSISAKDRALLEAERDGADAYLRWRRENPHNGLGDAPIARLDRIVRP